MEKNFWKNIYILNIYNWITLLYSRNLQNIVNQLYFNVKKKKKNESGHVRKTLRKPISLTFMLNHATSQATTARGSSRERLSPWHLSNLPRDNWLPTLRRADEKRQGIIHQLSEDRGMEWEMASSTPKHSLGIASRSYARSRIYFSIWGWRWSPVHPKWSWVGCLLTWGCGNQ